MSTLFGPIMAAALLAQAPSARIAAGTVVDDQGKPIAGATVVMYAPPTPFFKGDSVTAQAVSDGAGGFELQVPPLGRVVTNGVHLWAIQPGLAVAAVQYAMSKPHQIVLRKPDPRSVKVEGPDGKPVAGARVEARLIFFTGGMAGAVIPGSVASPLAATTGPDGTATFAYLRGRDRLVAARVTADAIGEQDLPVAEETRQGSVGPTFVIKLKKTSRLSGRIIDERGKGVAGQTVEIWPRGGGNRFIPNLVGFKNGPVRTGADGAFQTPDNLMIGSSYRVAVREPNKEPIIADWLRITEQPVTLAPLQLRALRTVTGRVIDRQGKAIADVEVFQSGDGPARTAVTTDADGRFVLNGFPHGPGFLFARRDGFRFQGRMLKPGDHDITVESTRTSERPEQELTKLADPIPLAESRGMACRILDSWWKAAAAKGDDGSKFFVVQFLIPADPVGALQKMGTIKFPTEKSRSRLQSLTARALGRTDFDEGETVAESIVDPGMRAGTLAHLADLLPDKEKPRKLAILDRAAVQARATSTPSDHVHQLGEVAGRLLELGEINKAKELFAEGLRHAKTFNDVSFKRRSFAALLARVNLSGAMELAKQLAGSELYEELILSSIAFGLRWDQPAEVERFLSQYPPETAGRWLRPTVTWKIATLDPRRARRLIDTRRDDRSYFQHEFCLALGAKGRDDAISSAAVQAGLRALDRVLRDEPEKLMQSGGEILPVVEAIDAALVAEVMWRAIAGRPPSGNPRAVQPYAPTPLIEGIAWYDRAVAAALLDPLLQRMEKSSDRELTDWDMAFEAWTLIDPRAAVARLNRVAMTSVNPNDNRLWIYVIEKLAHDRDERWRTTFPEWAPIFNPANRDFMIDRF